MSEQRLRDLVTELGFDPKNTTKMYHLAREYDRLEQGAMAISLYLRAADIEENNVDLQYRCMVYMSECYHRQGDRKNSVLASLQHAVMLDPSRPEAYWLMCKIYEEFGDWRNMGIFAEIGLKVSTPSDDPITDIGYPGRWVFYYYKAYSDWKWKGGQPAKEMLFNFRYRMKKGPFYAHKALELQMREIGVPEFLYYKKQDFKRARFKFPGLENVERNYSSSLQDLFVLTVLNGKKNGSYVELGSGHPHVGNNTALLEEKFGWRGISLDNNQTFAREFSEERKNSVLCADSTGIDYSVLFKQFCLDDQIDYLQIDVDDATYDTLLKIPFDQYKFGVITIEHDHYRWIKLDPEVRKTRPDIREFSRKYLSEKGYVLLVPDAGLGPRSPYEDWWIHPSLVESCEHLKPQDPGKSVNFVWEYLMHHDEEYLDDIEEFLN